MQCIGILTFKNISHGLANIVSWNCMIVELQFYSINLIVNNCEPYGEVAIIFFEKFR